MAESGGSEVGVGETRVGRCGKGRRVHWSAIDHGTHEHGGLGVSRGKGRARAGPQVWAHMHLVGSVAGPKLHARLSVGTGRPGSTDRPSRRAHNGAEARTCRSTLRHILGKRSRSASSTKNFLEPLVEAATSAILCRSAQAGGQLGLVLHGTGGQSGTYLYQYVLTVPASARL